ncbi:MULTISPECIES: hypothetical protein [unclassified Oleiphilus]|nr:MULTISPECIES: hypothetical protein [unclassified Oleiphilus]
MKNTFTMSVVSNAAQIAVKGAVEGAVRAVLGADLNLASFNAH